MPVASTTFFCTCASAGWAQGYVFPTKGTAFTRVGLQGVATQSNVLDTWNDGSIRQAIWTAHVPAGGNYSFELDPAPTGLPSFNPTWPSASVTFSDGATYTAALPAFSPSDSDKWHDGPLAVERSYTVTPMASSTPHPLIQICFDACGFSDGSCLIWVTVCNVRDSAAQRAVTLGSLTITIGSTTIFGPATKVIYNANRYPWSGSTGGYVEAVTDPDSEMLYASWLFPRILTSVSNNTYAQSGSTWEPGVVTGGAYFGDMQYVMGVGGEHPEFNFVDYCVAEYLVHHGPTQRARSIAHGILAGNWCGCLRQADGLTTIRLTDNPSFYPQSLAGQPSGYFVDATHVPQLALLPLVVTTRRVFLRIIQGWASTFPYLVWNGPANTNSYGSDINYDYSRNIDGMVCNLQASYAGEARGYRSLKLMEDAAMMTPARDAADKAYFTRLVQENVDRMDSYGRLNFFGGFNSPHYEFDPGQQGSYGGVHTGYCCTTFWQVTYASYSMFRAERLGFSSDNSYIRRAASAFLAIANSAPQTQWYYVFSMYYVRVAIHPHFGPHTVFSTWAEIFQANYVAPIGGFDGNDTGGTPGPPYYRLEYRFLLLLCKWLGIQNYEAALAFDEGTYGALSEAPARPGMAIADWTDVSPPTPAPRLVVQQPLGTTLSSGATQAFGTVFTGSTSSLTFTVKNFGNIDLTGLGITIDGTDAALFSVTSFPVPPVPGPSGSTTFVVRFAPLSIGAKAATLHLASNDVTANPFNLVLSGTGAVPTPQIAVEQPSGTVITSGATRNYGSVIFGNQPTVVFTIRNTGTANLTGVGASIDGTDAGLFTVIGAPAATIAPSGSTTCTVQFAPLTAGAKTATLHLASNDGTTNPFNVSLTGTGTDVAVAHLSVEQPAGTQLTSGAATGFGNVTVGNTTSLTFTIKNLGGASLTGVAVTIDGADATMFTVTAAPTATVAGLGSTTCTVTFTPTASGLRTATLHLASSDVTQNPFIIALTGTGGGTVTTGTIYGFECRGTPDFVQTAAHHTYTTGETSLQTRNGIAFQWLTPPAFGCVDRTVTAARVELAGGAVTVIGTQAVLSITLPSTGPKNIRCALGDAYYAGLNGQQLEILDSGVVLHTIGPVDIPFGSVADANGNVVSATAWLDSQTAKAVTFTSTVCTLRLTAAVQYATLAYFEIEDTSGVVPPQIVVEQPAGTGLTSGATRNFGSVLNGATSSLTFTIRNTGGSSLANLIATIDGTDAARFSVTTAPASSVAPSGSTTCTVQFAPLTAGAKVATLHLSSNDAASPFNVVLNGTGTAVATPHLVVEQPVGTALVSGGVSNFGSVVIAQSVSLTFTVRNLGGATLSGVGVTIIGADVGMFALTVVPNDTVVAAGSTSCVVRFLPTAAGLRTATLHLVSNDAASPFDLMLIGTGTSQTTVVDLGVYTEIDAGLEANIIDLDAGVEAFEGFDLLDPLNAGIEDV